MAAVRDGGRPAVGEPSRDGGVLVVIVGGVPAPPAPAVLDVVAADATVPRSSLANCSLALGLDVAMLLLLLLLMPPLPVCSSAASSFCRPSSACDATVTSRWFSVVRRCRRDSSLRTARSVDTSSGGSSLRRSASSFSRCTSTSLRNTIYTVTALSHSLQTTTRYKWPTV